MAKLLLVEDDNNLREIYEARLQAEGYQIVSAKDGEEALVIAKAEKPDLVISDVMMPKISGFEMLDILRNTPELQGVKVIMLTALGQTDDQKRADKLGADRYLVKSQVTLEDIVKTAHELLGDQASGDQASGTTPPADGPAPSGPPPAPSEGQAPADAGSGAPTDGPAASDSAAPAATAPSAPEPQPDPAPAPVAATPAEPPTPAPAPAPAATAPDPGPDTPAPTAASEQKPQPDPAPSDKAAKSTAQEEADVEAKIEDFVTGASSEPTAPAATDQPDDPSAGAPADAGSASDDKLMADAVDALVASTDDGKQAAAGDKTAGTEDTAPAGKPAAPADDTAPKIKSASAAQAGPQGSDDAGDDEGDDTPESAGGVKKVIKPIDRPPKKDINQLLAEEEAKEGVKPGATVIGSGSSEPEDRAAGAPMARPSEAAGDRPSEPDPGSIAL